MTRSQRGLDWLNFFVANFQTGFGPFISVYLTGVGWTQGAIGAALSAGTVAGMVSQVPGGALVDGLRSKRAAAAAAIIAIMASALLIALWPALLLISLAEILHAFASSVLGPAIAALSLALVDPSAFGEGSAAMPASWQSATLSRQGSWAHLVIISRTVLSFC